MNAALLLLADGRFPSEGHAHSAGAEAGVGVGDVGDVATLAELVDGRLHTNGIIDAAFVAATCARCAGDGDEPWVELEREYFARTGSPRLRAASRTTGRLLLRTGGRTWPSLRYAQAEATLGPAVIRPVAMGIVVGAAGCTPAEAALAELHHLVGALTTAAVRLLGLDPFAVAALAAGLAPELERLASEAGRTAQWPLAHLRADVALLHDVLAEHHATWEVRLFAS